MLRTAIQDPDATIQALLETPEGRDLAALLVTEMKILIAELEQDQLNMATTLDTYAIRCAEISGQRQALTDFGTSLENLAKQGN